MILIAALFLAVGAGLGYVARDLFLGPPFDASLFDEPQSKEDVFDDLESLGCRVYEGSWSGESLSIGYTGFLEHARGRTVYHRIHWRAEGAYRFFLYAFLESGPAVTWSKEFSATGADQG